MYSVQPLNEEQAANVGSVKQLIEIPEERRRGSDMQLR